MAELTKVGIDPEVEQMAGALEKQHQEASERNESARLEVERTDRIMAGCRAALEELRGPEPEPEPHPALQQLRGQA